MMFYDYGFNHMWGFGPFWGMFMFIFWIIVAIIIIRLLSGGRGMHHQADKNQDRAMDILKERYAKGEINKEEFESKKKDLKD